LKSNAVLKRMAAPHLWIIQEITSASRPTRLTAVPNGPRESLRGLHAARWALRLNDEVISWTFRWHPVGRPPKVGYEEVIELGKYQAESWRHAQRVLLVIIDRPDPKTGQLNLRPDDFFLVVGWTEAELEGPAALEHYRQRGTFEDRIKGGRPRCEAWAAFGIAGGKSGGSLLAAVSATYFAAAR
jgi:hypothetical protein